MSTILAIDIGGTKIAAALVSSNNQLSEQIKVSTPASPSQSDLSAALEKVTQHFAGKFSYIAVASTGIINEGMLTALNPNNLGGLKNFPLRDFLQSVTNTPCFTLNDAQAAAWAEFEHRKDLVNDLTFITVSTGVGGGIIQNRQLLTGQRNVAGHLGHTIADPNGPLCGCGRIGCVEAIASGRAIAAQATDELKDLDTKGIFTQYYQHNKQAEALIHHSAKTIANLAVDVKALLDSDCIILGGSVGLAAGYIDLVKQFISNSPSSLQIAVYPAHFSHEAGLLGAALWAKTQY